MRDSLLAFIVSIWIGLIVALIETYQWGQAFYKILMTVIAVSSFILMLWQIFLNDREK
ncbi:MAG: hypothetical protein IPL26_22655 [Leptospiraceae bacterium]|nr:hypothetical protein [Leptospiraceae bacterium]